LRKRGIEALDEYYKRISLVHFYKIGDIYKAPLWEVMYMFGNKSYMGPEPPFDTEIEINENI